MAVTLLRESPQALDVAPAGDRRPPLVPFPRRTVLVGGVDEPPQAVSGVGVGAAVQGESHGR